MGEHGEQETKDYLPERYITAVPFYPTAEQPVRELNCGTIARESPCFGVERFSPHTTTETVYVYLGDVVEYVTDDEDSQSPIHRSRGRVVAIYLDGEKVRLCLSVKAVLTSAEVQELYEPGRQAPVYEGSTDHSDLWELDLLEEHIPVACVTAKVDSSRLRGRGSLANRPTASTTG